MTNWTRNIIASATLLQIVACGGASKSSQTQSSEQGLELSEMIDVKLSFSSKDALSLASASSFEMSLTGCESGLSYTGITSDNPIIQVYKNDLNCRVELNSFTTSSGTRYVATTSYTANQWQANSILSFNSDVDPIDQLSVSVASQLSSPVEASDSVSFVYSQASSGGSQTIADESVSSTHNLEVSGQEAPDLTVTATNFNGIVSGGAGDFSFTLECNSALVGSICSQTDLTSMRYRLIKNEVAGELSLSEAAAYFQDPQAVSSVISGDIHSDNNGGFIIDSIEGPGPIHTNGQMILILEANGSYKYFTIDVEILQYSASI